MKKEAFIYTIKVWLTAVIVAPILILGIHFYFLSVNDFHPFTTPKLLNEQLVKMVKMMSAYLVLYTIFGTIFYFIVLSLCKRNATFFRIKVLITIFGFLLILLPMMSAYWYLWSLGTTSKENHFLMIQFIHNITCELLTVISGIWIYRLRYPEQLIMPTIEIHKIQ